MTPAKLVAHAKLTTSLRIVGVRDDGLHLIEAEMVSLDLADVLAVTDGTGVSYTGPFAPELEPGTDLVTKALKLVGRIMHVEVAKRIPPGGGLGGGSSDAAAILRWAGFDDLMAAAKLGADVPFCLVGGSAHVSGIGEVVQPLEFEQRIFTLQISPFGCNTAAVYRCWDAVGSPVGPNGNDLELAAITHEPRLAQWRDKLGDTTGQTPRLAGSGSTWFVEGEFPGDGRIVTQTVSG